MVRPAQLIEAVPGLLGGVVNGVLGLVGITEQGGRQPVRAVQARLRDALECRAPIGRGLPQSLDPHLRRSLRCDHEYQALPGSRTFEIAPA